MLKPATPVVAVFLLSSLLAPLTSCDDDGGSGGPADTGDAQDVQTDGDTSSDVVEDLPPGQARWTRPAGYAALQIAVDDSANQTYADGQMEWNGSFIYDAATNIVVFSASWLPDQGPFPPLYDDGPYAAGGHEAIGQVAGDHVFSAEVFFLAEQTTTFEYGLINELDDWIWVGPNALLEVEGGETGTIVAPGLTFDAFGAIDLRLTLDSARLHAEFASFDPAADALFVKGTMVSWRPIQLLDNGERGDAATGDGIFTFTLSEALGDHDGLVAMGQEVQFVYVFFEATGIEYKLAGNALPNGVTAYTTWDGGDFLEEELLLRSDSRGATLNTAIVVGPDESPIEDPVLRFIEPDRGPTTGGTPVEVQGEGFQVGATVAFGEDAADCAVQSESILTCTTPARTGGGGGVVSVRVDNPDGGFDVHQLGFTYVDTSSAPRVDGVDPALGSEVGGTAVTLTGANFADGATVTFGGELASGVTVVGPAQIDCVTPAGAPGPVDVVVRNPDTQTGALPNGFVYEIEGIDYATVQWPTSTVTVGLGQDLPELYGRVYERGVTEGSGQGAGITAEVVIGPDGEDPTTDFTDWTAHAMVYWGDLGNDDEYRLEATDLAEAGSYDWAVRFSLDGGSTWTWGDLDGSLNGYDPAQAGSIVVSDGILVQALEPPAISILGAATIGVSGAGFGEGLLAAGRPNGSTADFAALDLDFVDATAADLVFPAPEAGAARDAGRYDLRLTLDEDVLTLTDAYLVGFVRSPTVDGAIAEEAADWHAAFRHAESDLESSWPGNALHAVYTSFDEEGLYLGLSADLQRDGTDTDPGNVLVVYVDVDYGSGRGFARMSTINDEDPDRPAADWRLDRAITSNVDASGVTGFGADFAFATFELEPVAADDYIDELTGWRRLNPTGATPGDNWWFPLADNAEDIEVAGANGDDAEAGAIETFVSWDVLYGQPGPPPGGARIALFGRVVNRWGDFVSNQALPVEPEDEDPWNVSDVVVLDVR